MITITPSYISITDWTARTGELLLPFGNVPTLRDEAAWREWGDAVASFSAIAALGAPRTVGFETFHQWAIAFNAQIKLLDY